MGSIETNFNTIILSNHFDITHFELMTDATWQETESLSAYSTTYTVEGLQPGCSYQVKVVAETSAGRGPTSDVVSVVTHGEPPGATPTDFRAVAASSTSIRFLWSGIHINSWHSTLIGYHIGFREDRFVHHLNPTNPILSSADSNSSSSQIIRLNESIELNSIN